MKKLTERQVMGVQNLMDHSSIDHVQFAFHKSHTYISIGSILNASLEDIVRELTKVFYVVEPKGYNPYEVVRDDGTLASLHDFDCGNGVNVSIHIYSSQKEKDSAPTEPHIVENIQSDYTTESEVVANA